MKESSPKKFDPTGIIVTIALVILAAAVILFIMGRGGDAGLPLVGGIVLLALTGLVSEKLKGNQFTFWVFAFLAAAMYYPVIFTNWGFNTSVLTNPLLQLIMFGMGTKLSPGDFARELRKPKGVMIGTVLVYTIMPLAGVALAKLFRFSPAVGAGVILIGACPGGAASNVMAYLANGNLALSVTITTFATLISPIVTPFLMKLFAGALIDIVILDMMISIFKLIILPIVAGVIVNRLIRNRKAILDRVLPKFSMLAILFFVTIVVAHNRDRLIAVGLALVAVAIIHNLIGYVLGYWSARAIGLPERDCRTICIEVGLKNGGMGMGLALDALKSADAALAPIIFGKWMNISGSALANYWRQRPVEEIDQAAVAVETD